MFKTLSLESIYASHTNPRKRFNQDDLQDLAASIREHGVMQPIIVRPSKDDADLFEIVAGERRWRASKIADKTDIPCSIQDLDDIETLRIQVIENMQRKDLDPLEEAYGLQQLITATGANGQKPWTPEELAVKIGKSRSYVYASLNLCKLTDFVKDQLQDNKIGRETALLLSRIPGEALQNDAARSIISREMSFRLTKDFIKRDYTFDLTLAKWDKFDETVLPDVPSCAKCPKRTGNYPELYPDIESPDVCTDNECFRNKKAAHAKFCIQTLPRVIHGDEAKKIAPYSYDSYITGGYERSLDRIYVSGIKASDIFGDDTPEPFLLVDEKNNIGPVYKESEVRQLAEAKLAEKIESGEIIPPEPKPPIKDKWQINRERREPLAKTLTDHHNAFLKECLAKMANPLESPTIIDHLQTEFAQYLDNNVRNEQLFLDAFQCTSLDQLTLEQMLVIILHSDFYDQFEVDYYDLDEDSDEFDPNKQFHECIKSLEIATGLAFTPMTAAQAREINAREETATPVAQAADAAAPVEPSEEDIAPGALPDIEPAEAAGNQAPETSAAETPASPAPLSNFEKIKLRDEARIAKARARREKSESAKADAE